MLVILQRRLDMMKKIIDKVCNIFASVLYLLVIILAAVLFMSIIGVACVMLFLGVTYILY